MEKRAIRLGVSSARSDEYLCSEALLALGRFDVIDHDDPTTLPADLND